MLIAQGIAKRNPGYNKNNIYEALKGRCTPPFQGFCFYNITIPGISCRAISTPSLRDLQASPDSLRHHFYLAFFIITTPVLFGLNAPDADSKTRLYKPIGRVMPLSSLPANGSDAVRKILWFCMRVLRSLPPRS